MNIADIDKNMKVESALEREGLKFYNIDDEIFRIYGVKKDNGYYRRMPESVAKEVSQGVFALSTNTAGGRIRFITDSPFVAINTKLPSVCRMNHMAYTGIHGFDMYLGTEYAGTFRPKIDSDTVDNILNHPKSLTAVTTVNMPLYNNVKDVYIGLHEDAKILRAPDYSIEKPVVFYGSSITQGGCASRPGTCYQNFLSRKFDFNYINLGFSGSARGEDAMAEYIASLDMSIFVYDYDHNAPSDEHYANTHEPMFRKIREHHPDMPILIVTRPQYRLTETVINRQEIAMRTYQNALADGDKNVYYIPGNKLIRDEIGLDCNVDGCHPTDLGFFSMASAMEQSFEHMIADYRARGGK
jgi:hypothetical protein